MTVIKPAAGYGRDGASEAHWVRDIRLMQALCGVTLETIPLHQFPPARVCPTCVARSATTAPVPASDVTGELDPPAEGPCSGCGETQALDGAGLVLPHAVERVRSGRTPCDGAGHAPEVSS